MNKNAGRVVLSQAFVKLPDGKSANPQDTDTAAFQQPRRLAQGTTLSGAPQTI